MRKIIFLVFLGWLTLNGSKEVLASGFHISEISGVATSGLQLKHWWNTSLQPTFRGEALPGAEINITIDSDQRIINADSSGNWAYQPEAALGSGDHQIVFTSTGSTVDFTLTLGTDNVDWEKVGKGGGETLPTVGTSWPTIIMLILGGGLVVWGGKIMVNVRS